MSTKNGRDCGEDVAAYVLGALEPDEAEAFRRHLADCPECREELAEFEQVTEALPPASAQYAVPRALRTCRASSRRTTSASVASGAGSRSAIPSSCTSRPAFEPARRSASTARLWTALRTHDLTLPRARS